MGTTLAKLGEQARRSLWRSHTRQKLDRKTQSSGSAMSSYLSTIALVIGVAGALLGIRAATVTIRDNQDAFISDLKRQSRWATYAAIAAAVAASLQALQPLL